MRIINTVDNTNSKPAVFIFVFLFLALFAGCGQENVLNKAKEFTDRSDSYYVQAVQAYKNLLSKGNDLDRLHFELGNLYYRRGEFGLAVEEFKKTSHPQAEKLLGISYYKLYQLTDALGALDKINSPDDESLYFKALTSEKLNLFSESLKSYKAIKAGQFKQDAQLRINVISRETAPVFIKDIDPQVYQLIKGAPDSSKYPQAGALVLNSDEKIQINSDHTQISTLHYLVKILNDRGKEEFSEAHIEYDTTYEKVELEFARTIGPNGEVTDVGSSHIRDVSKYLNFPLYSNAHVYIISFPEISEASCIEYKVKVYNNQLINKKDFVLSYSLQDKEPILSCDLNITLPQGPVLRIKNINEKYIDFPAQLKPEIKNEANNMVYGWHFKDIPAIIPEPNMPPEAEINPTILFSTFDDWQEIYNWWWQLAKDKIKIDTAIKEKITSLAVDKLSDEFKIRTIYNYCAQNIRYVAVEYGQAGYEPHAAAECFRNKYGDCKDQAILLVTMLREAGIEAFPVLIATREYYNLNPDLPSVLFNHCIAAATLNGRLIFLDPTAQTCSFGDLPSADQQRKVLVFKDSAFEIVETPLYPAQHNLVKQVIEIKVNSDESITAQKDIYTRGIYDQAQRYWLLYTQPQLVQQALKEKIQDVSIGAELVDYNIENLEDLNSPVVLRYNFRGPEYFTAAGSLRIMPQLSSLDTALVAKDRRKYPLDFNIPDTKENDFQINIPDNFKLKYLPQSLNQDSAWIKLAIEYKKEGNSLRLIQKIESKGIKVSPEEYPVFKNFLEDSAKKVKQRIVLEKAK